MNPEDIKNKVLEKIKKGDIHIRPKIYFVVQVVLVISVGILAIIASAFVLSFAFFSIYQSGELFLLGFGLRGLMTFLGLFPWLILILAGLLVFIFEWLMRHFKFNYRLPILYTSIIAVFLISILGLLISISPFHNNLLNQADRKELPFLGNLYENIRKPNEVKGEFKGVVVSISTSTLNITHDDLDNDTDDGTRTVNIPKGYDVQKLHIGDKVYVAGDESSDKINAYGLEVFDR